MFAMTYLREPYMVDGVDRKGRVTAQDSGDEESPHEQLRSVGVQVRPVQGQKAPDEQDDGGFQGRDPRCSTDQ